MVRTRFFSVISIFLALLIFSRTALYADSIPQLASNEVKEDLLEKDDAKVAYEVSPILEDTSNISSFNQKKYSCSDDESCEENDEEIPCKACAVASGVNCGISICTFGVAVVAMVIAALVIANAGNDNAYSH